ncbi:MAG: ADP-ribosylglycohydrolase family protein [Luteolibacter sp.]
MKAPTARQLVLPSLCADALALGCHWVYDSSLLSKLNPASTAHFHSPRSSYHPGKSAGDFTHYGDQTLVLLKSIVTRGGFDAVGWRDDWQKFWENNPPSYRDGATRATLGFLQRDVDAASESNDLAGASRIAPVLAALAAQPLEARIAAARAQTALTHGDLMTVDTAEFFTRAVDVLGRGASMREALEAAASARYSSLEARDLFDQAQAASELDRTAAAEMFGLACHTLEALPFTLWCLLRHHDQPLEALIQNTLAGGDNAARGLLIGLMMGAAHGTAWMPAAWTSELRAIREVDSLLALLESRS